MYDSFESKETLLLSLIMTPTNLKYLLSLVSTLPLNPHQTGMMMNSCWPYGGSTQQLNLASLDRPLYDSRTLAMLARQYQPSIMSALLSLSTNQNAPDDNNNSTPQRLTSTTNESSDEQASESNSNSNANSTRKLWRPLDIMR